MDLCTISEIELEDPRNILLLLFYRVRVTSPDLCETDDVGLEYAFRLNEMIFGPYAHDLDNETVCLEHYSFLESFFLFLNETILRWARHSTVPSGSTNCACVPVDFASTILSLSQRIEASLRTTVDFPWVPEAGLSSGMDSLSRLRKVLS